MCASDESNLRSRKDIVAHLPVSGIMDVPTLGLGMSEIVSWVLIVYALSGDEVLPFDTRDVLDVGLEHWKRK